MVDLEVRELHYFRAVARERSFTRAAEGLGIAQPPLSRAISRLERRLGVTLFERSNRGVTLTVAGLTLLGEADLALAALSAAVRRTRESALSAPVLMLTAKPGVATDLLRRASEVYGAQPDAASVRIVVSGYGEQAEMVRDGRADVALLGSPLDTQGVEAEPLMQEPRVAALPVGHVLAQRSSLSCADLVGLPMPHCPEMPASGRDYWAGRDAAAVAADACPPLSGPVVRDNAQLLEYVALGEAVALVPRSLARHHPRRDVTYLPVADATPYTTAIAWRAGSRDPWVARFVHATTELAGPWAAEVGGRSLIGQPGAVESDGDAAR